MSSAGASRASSATVRPACRRGWQRRRSTDRTTPAPAVRPAPPPPASSAPLGIEQLRLGERARRHHPGDGAAHDRLAGALLRLGRVLHLFGDGDAVAALDQPRQIGFGRVHRHPAHRNRHAGMFAAFGQRDIERRRRRRRIIEEQFVKIAHAEEQQAIGCLVLQRQILRDHRRRGGGGSGNVGHACGVSAEAGEREAATAAAAAQSFN